MLILLHLIGMTGNYTCNASILAKNITNQLTESEVELYLHEGRLGLLNASLSNIVQRSADLENKKQC